MAAPANGTVVLDSVLRKIRENSLKYYACQIVGFTLGLIGFALIKVIPVLICVSAIIWLDVDLYSPIGALIATVGFVLLVAIIGFPTGRYISEIGVKFLDDSEKFKKSFIAKYGTDVEKPRFEDFDLEPDDYYEYNRRFRLGDIGILIVVGFGFGAAFLFKNLVGFESELNRVVILAITIGVAIVTYRGIKFIDTSMDKSVPQFESVQKYIKAKQIYDSVQEELRQGKLNAQFK